MRSRKKRRAHRASGGNIARKRACENQARKRARDDTQREMSQKPKSAGTARSTIWSNGRMGPTYDLVVRLHT